MTLPVSGAPDAVPPARLRAAGKFFEDERGEPVWLNGVTYGPFPPNANGEPYPEANQVETDVVGARTLGFNTLRIYQLPNEALLAVTRRQRMNLIVGLAWTDHVDFLSDRTLTARIRQTVEEQATWLAQHPQVAAILIGNEIEKTLVRWMDPKRVRKFLEELIAIVRRSAPDVLCGYATYPSTEYLMPRGVDFFAANIYLEKPESMRSYLQRLQNLAGDQPLLITEFGIDVKHHGVEVQAEVMRWERQLAISSGAAGNVWFAFTDEWQRGGKRVDDWQFGLLDSKRQPRPSCALAATLPRRIEPPANPPVISVVVCTRNGARTLERCLASLVGLRYSGYEVIVVDDGSTDDVPNIAAKFPAVYYVRQDQAGLSVARNRGMREAQGSIIAYTDDDCIAHPDWLLHLAVGFERHPEWVAAGGPNIPPPPRNSIESVVAAAPGAPAHVLLNDGEAEHLPGCNLVIRKAALEAINGFDERFTTAGDDVDVCWRLRSAGGGLGFVPGAMVWHHRRFSILAYLRQQRGYGRAEALLMKAHPDRFGPLGGARWCGLIYGEQRPRSEPAEGQVFFGPFGEGLFQGIYHSRQGPWIDWLTGVWWLVPFLIALGFRQWWLAGAIFAMVVFLAMIRRRSLPRPPFSLGVWQECILWLLCLIQPMMREAARLMGMIRFRALPSLHPRPPMTVETPRTPQKWTLGMSPLVFWSEQGVGRHAFLVAFEGLTRKSGTRTRRDDGWRRFDLEMHPHQELSTAILSVTEYHGGNRCLTRVRPLMRFTPGILVAASMVLALEITLITMGRDPLRWVGVATLISTLGILLLLPSLALRPVKRLIRSAAEAAGMEEMKGRDKRRLPV